MTNDTERTQVKQNINDPGNYYISSGTWIKDTSHVAKDQGVVAEITDVHESGTVKILWFPNSTEYVSARMFREKLRRGRYEVDYERA